MRNQKIIKGDWVFEEFADKQYKIYLSAQSITVNTSEVTKKLPIDFAHRIIKTIYRHTDSANASATSALDIQLRRDVGNINGVPQASEILKTDADMITSQISVTFGVGFEYEPTVWTIGFIGINATDLVYPVFYIQRLD